MAECPVCDPYIAEDVQAALARIGPKNPLLLIALACDFAARVLDQTSDPAQAREWLQRVRNYESSREAVEEEAVAAWDICFSVDEAAGARRAAVQALAEAIDTTNAVALAEKRSLLGSSQAEANALGWAVNAATHAADGAAVASLDPNGERAWQMERIRALACICAVPQIDLPGARSRKSLLAR